MFCISSWLWCISTCTKYLACSVIQRHALMLGTVLQVSSLRLMMSCRNNSVRFHGRGVRGCPSHRQSRSHIHHLYTQTKLMQT